MHGGGKIASTISKALGIEPKMSGGRRITDSETLDVVTMVYGGLVNKKIVAALQGLGVNSFGLTGADGAAIISDKRSPIPMDYGFAGDPDLSKFGTSTLAMLLDGGYQPVVAPITMTSEGQLLNTNADTVAQTIATALSSVYEVELIYCFEKRGVLRDVEDDNSVISTIDPAMYEQLKADGIIADGMLPKMQNAFAAIEAGVRSVVICSSDFINVDGYGGTTLTK